MTMAELEDTIIKLSVRSITALIVSLVTIVSSFWIGYSSVISNQNEIKVMLEKQALKQELRDQKQDSEILALGGK